MMNAQVTHKWIQRFHSQQGQSVFNEALRQIQRGSSTTWMPLLWVLLPAVLCGLSFVWAYISLFRPGHNLFEKILACCALAIALRTLWLLIQNQKLSSLSRKQHPALYQLVDEVRSSLQHGRPIQVVLIPDFNAFYFQNLSGQAFLGLGAPLLVLLDERELVALIAHEVAHGVSKDPIRSRMMAFPVQFFGTWYESLNPDGLMFYRSSGEGMAGIATWISNYFMWAVAQIPRACMHLMHLSMMRESQIAEYRADALAARVAGSAAMQSSLKKLFLDQVYAASIHKQARYPQHPTLFDEFQHQLQTLSAEALSQLEEHARRSIHAFDSHPPTEMRQRFLDHFPGEGTVHLTAAAKEQMLTELQLLLIRIQKETLDEYLYHMD